MLAGETSSNTRKDMESPEKWQAPKWLNEKISKTIHNYEIYFALQLRTRYMELESEFQFVKVNVDTGERAKRIVEFLKESRSKLEEDKPNMSDLITVSGALDMAERYLIWLYDDHIVKHKIESVIPRLESIQPEGWNRYVDELKKLINEHEKHKGHLRAELDEAIGACNKKVIEEQINSGLQIERLKTFRLLGILILAAFLIVSPLITSPAGLEGWPSKLITGEHILIAAWINALGIAIMGAVGGFISGLLQVRSSRITLQEFQENKLKLQLKPLAGAVVALVLFVLLSWSILPGIKIENAGSYFFIAFFSGFSERYFLQLLELKAEKPEEELDETKLKRRAGKEQMEEEHASSAPEKSD